MTAAAAAATPAQTSVVIVSYFTGPELFEAIQSALDQEGVADVVVVDNGNPAEALSRLHALCAQTERLTVITGHGNIGFGSGCNLGARAARGSYLLFLNPDARLPAGAVLRLISERLHQPGPGPVLLAPKLLDSAGREQRGSRRNEMTPWSVIVEAMRLDRLLPRCPAFQRINQHTATPLTQTTPIPVASGACMFFRKDDFWSLGGFDQGYFLHVEDIDLSLRVRQAGGKVLHVPGVEIRHVGGTSDAPALIVERYKVDSFRRYFHTHFKGKSPPGQIALVMALVWARYGARVVAAALYRAQAKRGAKGAGA